MRILGLGIDYSTGEPLFVPEEEETFADRILKSLDRNSDDIHRAKAPEELESTFRGEIERPTIDQGDPRSVGWTFLLNANDPNRAAYVEALRPLAEHRGMMKTTEPLLFNGEPPEDWFDWLTDNYSPLKFDRVPHFVLIAGGPEQVPFRFQSLLDTAAACGRVAFDSVDDLQEYVAKVIRLETAPTPVVNRHAVFFAPDPGPGDPTHYSRHFLAKPLEEVVRTDLSIPTTSIMGGAATKAGLLEAFRSARPALVFTASHGMLAPKESLDVQKRFNGAICCQRKVGASGSGSMDDWLLGGDDVPTLDPFLEGSVVFQFACFGYGTPRESDYNHWRLGDSGLTIQADTDFVAALPKRLLANPHGPVGYVGHMDAAWLHGFTDEHNPDIAGRWHPRAAPFLQAVRSLLQTQPAGISLAGMHQRFNFSNALLTDAYDRQKRKPITLSPTLTAKLASAFILRNDAQNYMVYGDPAARLRIPD